MESPVMTSASSHRLRSAVSACAQPTHSYLSSSYLGTSIQRESHHSGGCLKKFGASGKNGDSAPQNVYKKSGSGGEFSGPYKRHKACGSGPRNHHRREKPDGREAGNSPESGVANLIPKQFLVGNDLLSKLKLNGLAEYWDRPERNESVGGAREKVINGKASARNGKKSTNNGSCDNNACGTGSKAALNHRNGKGKSKPGKKDALGEGSERGDGCCGCGAPDAGEAPGSDAREASEWQPDHVVTRRPPRIARNAWRTTAESSTGVPAEVAALSSDLPPFPSEPRVGEMLEHSGKPTTNSVGFGDFGGVAKDFVNKKIFRVTEASLPLPRSPEKNAETARGKLSKGMSRYEVFLGGSCNPTTWRTDLAIPELEKMGISYYNPQVEEWRPELMEAEFHAKENATVMFFVIDNQTRGVSALIEVAHLAGARRKLILVIQSYTQKNQTICDEAISQSEYEDLKTGQDVLQDLVERQGIPVFDDIKVALACTERILRENLRVQDLRRSVRSGETSPSAREVFERFDSGNSGEIFLGDACSALRMLTGVPASAGHLEDLLAAAGKDWNGTTPTETKFSFQEFVELLVGFRRQQEEGMLSNAIAVPGCCKDVYLGGTLENTSWREFVAIPMLEAEKLSFFVPRITDGGKRFSEIEAAAMENSSVLLFVVTNTARSIAAMAIAGHYIGRGADVVLCVEHLPEEATIAGEKLSESAVKDYNRGRMYLMDIARRSGVPVFDEISMAVQSVIRKCRNR